MKILLVIAACILGFSHNVYAQGLPFQYESPQAERLERMNRGNNEYRPPIEPSLKKVEFLKLDPPRSLKERIERLIHGIYTDVPPEYDHYGYEIRRYMSHVGNPNVYKSENNIRGQIQNIENAQIIMRYWREHQQKEIDTIEAEIEQRGISPTLSTSLKYHRGVAEAFFVEAESWMNNNKTGLEYLLTIGPEAYSLKNGVIRFKEREFFMKYASIYEAQQKALKRLQEYTPFRMMVY